MTGANMMSRDRETGRLDLAAGERALTVALWDVVVSVMKPRQPGEPDPEPADMPHNVSNDDLRHK